MTNIDANEGIARLIEERKESIAGEAEAGHSDGRNWAISEGSYEEILGIAKVYENFNPNGNEGSDLESKIEFYSRGLGEFNQCIPEPIRDTGHEGFFDGFIDGVVEVFSEVEAAS